MNGSQQITLPKKLFFSMYEACQKWEQFRDELEDFLLSENETEIKKIRKSRQEHLAGKIKNIDVLKKTLG